AMMHAAQGRPNDAWEDLLACHRLGRLVGRGGTLIEGLVGVAIDTIASRADLVLLDSGKLTAKQLRGCLRDLEKLPPLPEIASAMDLWERFLFLDAVMMIDRRGVQYLEKLFGIPPPKSPDPAWQRLLASMDWDTTLRTGNRLYDQIVAALRTKDRA